MGQTTASARTTALSRSANYYVWSFPGSVTVQLSLDVVVRLAKHLPMLPQGLLLGQAAGTVTQIDDFKILSAVELLALRDKAVLPPIPLGLRVMGFFRVQRDEELRLNPEDLALAKAGFSKPEDVFLVVQSGADGAKASFFFWDGDQMYGDFAFLEFPFDASCLSIRKNSRMERPAEQSPPVTEAAPALKEAPPPQSTPPPELVRSGSTGWRGKMWGMLAAIFLGSLVGIFVALKFLPGISPKPSLNTARPAASIALDIEHRPGGDLKVTWNREIPAVLNATTGTLLVQDGAAQRKITLDKQLMHTGSLLYSPASDQIQISLTIQGTETATETVVVVISKSPAAEQP